MILLSLFDAVFPCIPTIKVCGTEGRMFDSCRVRQQLKLPNINLIEKKMSSVLKYGMKRVVHFPMKKQLKK